MLRALLALCAANASESVQVLSAGFLIDEIATVPFDQIAIAASVYLGMFIGGAILGVYYGFPFDRALFESTSATVNGGMSVGVLAPDNPVPMKLFNILQMWLGRLEFMAVFALGGYAVAMVRGR